LRATQRRQHEIIDLPIETFQLFDQLPGDQQCQRVQRICHGTLRRRLARASIPGRQNDEALGAERDGDPDRRVARDCTVGEIQILEMHGREGRRYCGTGQDGIRGRALGQHDGLAGQNVGRNDVIDVGDFQLGHSGIHRS